ncbi:MFS transporter [Chitinophaga sp. NPDC101104]|uniref:MFS transporter n=1 Tax=Chitinophaga sp. NPDC101104 TaxID=3390561 RepID=UPI003D00BB9F
MNQLYDKGLFHSWVPRPLALLLIGVFELPVLAAAGVYTGNISDMVGSLGTYTEVISMANYANVIGMGAVVPVILRLERRFRGKELLVGCFLALAALSVLCAMTTEPLVIVGASFLMGVFKMLALLKMIPVIMFLITPTGDRGKFYSFYYTISIVTSQLVIWGTTGLAYKSEWQAVYYAIAGILLINALLAVIFMHNKRSARAVSLKGIDWWSMAIFAAAFLLLDYVLVFARQQAWFASASIQWAAVGFVVLAGLFVWRQLMLRHPFIDVRVFRKTPVWHGLLLLISLGVYMGTAAMQTTFTTGVLGYDNYTNAILYAWMIPGIIAGGIMGAVGFKRGWHLKYFIFGGYLCFMAYSVSMYFLMAPVIDIEYLYAISVVKGLGMTVLFIGIWYYAMSTLPMDEMLSAVSVLMVVRTFVGVALFAAVYSWAQYQLQWQSAANLATGMDAVAFDGGMAIYGQLQIQAVLDATKTLYGYVCIGGLFILTYVLTHHFGRLDFRRMVTISRAISGTPLKARFRRRRDDDEGDAVAAAAAAA